MTNCFMISDTHFGHQKSCEFLRADGITKMRPFDTAEEMDETIIERWNAVVKPKDRVYVLGDVAMKRKDIKTIARCNGRKVLIRGNHDIFNMSDYTPYFDDIRGVHVMPARDAILSHIPLHLDSIVRFNVNIHGHLHEKVIDDPRYFNVCVENTNYTPMSYEEIKAKLK